MSRSDSAAIAAIIVNYGTADLAAAAVESVLARDHGGRAVTVHLVDNASPGGDGARLAARARERGWGARVVLHLETENHGFGRGNNLVFEHLAALPEPPGKVFLLNPDAALANEAIAVLAEFLDTHPAAAVAGAQVCRPDGAPAVSAFRFPSVISEFSDTLAFGPVLRLCARWQVALDPALPTGRVDWVTGAAVMFRFDALRVAGGFDPAFFLYYEEVDLMRRITRAGGEVWHVAEARVSHVEGAATGVQEENPERRRTPGYWYDSWRTYFLNNHGPGYARACALAALAGAAGHHVTRRLRGREPHVALQFFGDFTRLVLRPLFAPGAARAGRGEAQ